MNKKLHHRATEPRRISNVLFSLCFCASMIYPLRFWLIQVRYLVQSGLSLGIVIRGQYRRIVDALRVIISTDLREPRVTEWGAIHTFICAAKY